MNEAFQFQIESAVGGNVRTQNSSQLLPSPETFQAGLESLVLGLRLRGFITDSERLTLDYLAPMNHLTFMLKDEEYLHPTDCPLFSVDTIRSSRSVAAGAIFQHRYEPDDELARGAYTIHSAQINPYGQDPITLGLIGPEADGANIRLKEQFGCMIEMARLAWQSADRVIAKLNIRFEPGTPLLLINRCSGRVFHVSQPALQLLDCQADRLIDQEFSIIRPTLADAIGHTRLTMSNFTIENFMFSSMEMLPQEQSTDSQPSDLLNRMIHKIRNKLTSISSASSLLHSNPAISNDPDLTELTQIIMTEADATASIMNRIDLLLTYDDQPKLQNSLKDAVNSTAATIKKRLQSSMTLEISKPIPAISIDAPQGGLQALIEATIMSHAELGGQRAKIRFITETELTTLVLTSDMAHQAAKPARLWHMFAEQLSQMMGHRLTTSSECTTGIITTIEFDTK